MSYTPSNSPESEWPWSVRAIAKLRSPEDKGVGDTIARNLSHFGADAFKTIYKNIFSGDCGCGDRQAKLNEAFPYKKEEAPQ